MMKKWWNFLEPVEPENKVPNFRGLLVYLIDLRGYFHENCWNFFSWNTPPTQCKNKIQNLSS